MTVRSAQLDIDENLPFGGHKALDLGGVSFMPGATFTLADGTTPFFGPGLQLASGQLTVKVGNGLSVDSEGNLYATGGGGSGYTLPAATATTLGGVRGFTGLTIDEGTGALSLTKENVTGLLGSDTYLAASAAGGFAQLGVANAFQRKLTLGGYTDSSMSPDHEPGEIDFKDRANTVRGNIKGYYLAAGSHGLDISALITRLNGSLNIMNGYFRVYDSQGNNTAYVNAAGAANFTSLTTGVIVAQTLNLRDANGTSVASIGSTGAGAFASLTVGGSNVLKAGDQIDATSVGGVPYIGSNNSGQLDLETLISGEWGGSTYGAVGSADDNDLSIMCQYFKATTGLSVGSQGYFTGNVTNRIRAFRQSGGGALVDFQAAQLYCVGVTSNQPGSVDVAELVPNPVADLEAGDLTVLDPDSDEAVKKHVGGQYDLTVAGIVATQPGLLLGADALEFEKDENGDLVLDEDGNPVEVAASGDVKVPVAMAGRVPAKVTVLYENADGTIVKRPIRRGMMLVSSAMAGHLVAADPSDKGGHIPLGTVVGKAMQDFDPADGEPTESMIKVWVNLA